MNRLVVNQYLLVLFLTALTLSCGSRIDGKRGLNADASVKPELESQQSGTIRVATFNVALNRPRPGELKAELMTGQSEQAKAIAAIIQEVRPHVLLLQEFDHQGDFEGIGAFQQQYLAVAQNNAQPIVYAHRFLAPSNTGIPSGFDLDRDGRNDGPGDAIGYGSHPGQYAFVLLSQFPLVENEIRTFRHFLWRDVPNAKLPYQPGLPPRPWYEEAALDALRLSSKNHIDVPIRIGSAVLHVIAAHPTPPVFDGPEDRNGCRNYDEIKLLVDYIDEQRGAYLEDDAEGRGALSRAATFVIVGDLNADPEAGDAVPGAIEQLLRHPRLNQSAANGEQVPISAGAAAAPARFSRSSPASITASWGLRVDYVLPSENLNVSNSGVYWPAPGEAGAHLVGQRRNKPTSSDHRLVWVDIHFPNPPQAPIK